MGEGPASHVEDAERGALRRGSARPRSERRPLWRSTGETTSIFERSSTSSGLRLAITRPAMPSTDADAEAESDFLAQPVRGPGDELVPGLVGEQDRDRVRVHRSLHRQQRATQEVVEGAFRTGGGGGGRELVPPARRWTHPATRAAPARPPRVVGRRGSCARPIARQWSRATLFVTNPPAPVASQPPPARPRSGRASGPDLSVAVSGRKGREKPGVASRRMGCSALLRLPAGEQRRASRRPRPRHRSGGRQPLSASRPRCSLRRSHLQPGRSGRQRCGHGRRL